MGFLVDPNVAFILLTHGRMGILVELLNPVLIVPGTGGVTALASSLVALVSLPVSWVAVGMIGLPVLLIFFELHAPGIGLFGLGGVISFIMGGLLLSDGPAHTRC